jgi:hypothetical protein
MNPNEIEVDHIWEQFKREWKYLYWPTPHELCSRLTKFRQSQASVRKASGFQEHEPSEHGSEIPHRPYSHREFMAALDTTRCNASENHPRWGALDRAIQRMGEALLRNRDDNDEPRYART